MIILKYKLNGQKVSREEFLCAVDVPEFVIRWENAVWKFADDLEREVMSVVLHMNNGELKVIAETRILMKLYCEVYKSMFLKEAVKNVARV